MDQRLARAVAGAVLAALPLLAGCGTGSAQADGPVTPPSLATTSPGSDAAAPVEATPTPSPTVDPERETARVQAATEKFVKTVLTIGYPDKSFDDYTGRIEPLMTQQGFASLESADSIKKGSTALTSLYAQKARSAPRFSGKPEVTSLDAGTATAQLAYENVAQQRSGDGWKTLKTLGKGSVTVRLVRQDGTWLVDNAS